MPKWVLFHDWMKFKFLDENAGLTCSFTIGYRFTDDASDDWTGRFNRFKAKKQAAIRGGLSLMTDAVPILIQRLGLDPSRTAFLPALSSSETMASESGLLSKLARTCADEAGTVFVPDVISKKTHMPLHNSRSADKRRELLEQAHYKAGRIRARDIVIFDDLITRGGTLSHIAQAIHKTNRGVNVYGVCLGKTENRGYHKRYFDTKITNDHVPKKWAESWKRGEMQ